MIVTFGEAWPFQLLLAELGPRVQTSAEQRPHLLRCHPIPCGKTVDPSHPGANPPPGGLPCSVKYDANPVWPFSVESKAATCRVK